MSKATLFSLIVLIVFFWSCSSNERGAQEKYNVLFIAVDDLRPQLNCYGRKGIVSPNIDKLASEGTIFLRAYCNVPVCGASRASLLTGMRPTRGRFLNFSTNIDRDAPGIVTLPGHFRNNGYYTISNSKVAHIPKDCRDAWDEEWRPVGSKSWRNYLLSENIARDDSISRGLPYEMADVPDSAYFDGETALKTIRDLQKLKKAGKPFFLAVGFLKPHLPFNAPKKYWDLYDPKKIGLADNPTPPENSPEAAIHNSGELRAYHGVPKSGPLPDSLALKLRHGYHACVSYTDAQIGLIMEELERLDLKKNTIIVLWGDHGWNLGEHGMWCKHCNFNTSLNAPLIMAVPGFKKGRQTKTIAEFIDIYPTLCDLNNLPLPEHLEGKSLANVLKDPDHVHKDYAVSKYGNGLTLIRGQYLYTEWRTKDDSLYARMLYDHRIDPDENTNICELPVNADLVKELSTALRDKRGRDY